jgi:hypothetical protein
MLVEDEAHAKMTKLSACSKRQNFYKEFTAEQQDYEYPAGTLAIVDFCPLLTLTAVVTKTRFGSSLLFAITYKTRGQSIKSTKD